MRKEMSCVVSFSALRFFQLSQSFQVAKLRKQEAKRCAQPSLFAIFESADVIFAMAGKFEGPKVLRNILEKVEIELKSFGKK